MKRIIFYFLIVLASIWLGLKIYQHPGYVLINYKDWVIETTLWFAIVVAVLFMLLLHFLYRLFHYIAGIPTRIHSWSYLHKHDKSTKNLNLGFRDFILGKMPSAEKLLVKSANLNENTFISYCIAAAAAQNQGAIERRNEYLKKAEGINKNDFLIDLIKAQLHLQSQQPELALSYLIRLRQLRPHDSYILKLLAESYLDLQDWSSLPKLFNELRRNHLFDDKFEKIEQSVYLHLLNSKFFADFSDLQLLWNSIPKRLRKDTEILISYSQLLCRWNRTNEAEDLLLKQLKSHPDAKLLEQYAKIPSANPTRQLTFVEKFLKLYPDDPLILKCLGILCLHNQLWGQARDYLERSLKLRPTPEIYSALGQTYEKLEDNKDALQYYRKGLLLATKNSL
jgi:HemY protein